MKSLILQLVVFCFQFQLSNQFAVSQSIAGAATTTGVGFAGATAAGGSFAATQATAFAGRNSAAASASATAFSGGSTYRPKPYYKPTYKPKYDYKPPKKDYYYPPKKSTKYHPAPYYYSYPKPVVKKPVVVKKCDTVKSCYDFDYYTKCGYCLIDKYPIYGHGCDYDVYYGKKTEYKPKCDCKGTFIYDKSACPSCATVLVELTTCAGYDKKYDKYDIPKYCIDKVKVTIDYLKDCGYMGDKKKIFIKD